MIFYAIRILALVGLWLSGLSLYEHVAAKAGLKASSICRIGQSFDCSAVAKSTWSEWFGIPLASWGLAFYFLIFVCSFLVGREALVPRRVLYCSFLLVNFTASIFSIFLFGISYYSVGKLCPLCIGMYLVNFGLMFSSYQLSRSESVIKNLFCGLSCYLKFPKVVLGFQPYSLPQKSLARLFAIIAGVAVFFTAGAEEYISKRLIAPIQGKQLLLQSWEQQAKEDLKLDRSQNAFSDKYMGVLGSKIEVVEFSDFECPGCQKLFLVLKDVFDQYKDNVVIFHKNFPLDDSCNSAIPQKFHEHSCYLANYARCAGEQGKFWETADTITRLTSLTNTVADLNPREELKQSILHLGLDPTAIDECVNSGRQLDVIKKDVQEAIALDIQGTPTVWVNSKRFEGRTVQDFKQLFDHILSESKN